MANQALSILKHFIYNLKENYEVVGFYPYTSHVINRLLGQSFGNTLEDIAPELKELLDKCIKDAEEKGARHDNKVVYELASKAKHNNEDENVVESHIFIGWYDNNISIGFGVWQEKFYSQRNLFLNKETGKFERKMKKVKMLSDQTAYMSGNCIEKDEICTVLGDWGKTCDIKSDKTGIRICCIPKTEFVEVDF